MAVRKRFWNKKDGLKEQFWEFDYKDEFGRRKVKGGFKTKAEAEIAEAKIKTQVNEGTYISQNKTITFAKAAEIYMNLHAEIHCKPSTLASYKSYLNNHLLPFMGDMKLVDITPNKVNLYMQQKLKDKSLSNNSINKSVILIGSIIQRMVDDGVMIQNPVSKVKRLQLPHQEMLFLINEEIKVVLDTAKTYYPDYYPLLLTAILTGMREGELLALTWDKINWKTNKISVTQSLYRGKLVSPKTATSVRKVDMPDELIKTLKEWKLRCPVGQQNFIFPNAEGNPMDPGNMVKRRFYPVLSKAGVAKVRFHDLRHTYASILIAQNVPIKYIQTQMGHSSIQVTMDRYGHLMPEVYQQGIEALNNLFEKENPFQNIQEYKKSSN